MKPSKRFYKELPITPVVNNDNGIRKTIASLQPEQELKSINSLTLKPNNDTLISPIIFSRDYNTLPLFPAAFYNQEIDRDIMTVA